MDVNGAVPLNKHGICPFPCLAGGTNMFHWAPLWRPLTHALSPGGTLHLSGAPNLTEAVQGALLAVKGSAVFWGVFSFHAAMFFCWEQIGLCWCKVIHMVADFLLVAVVTSLPGGGCGGSSNALICHICPKGWQMAQNYPGHFLWAATSQNTSKTWQKNHPAE